jgi:hypothetical protein
VILRRRRFHDVVERQLDLFESETELLTEAAETDAAWTTAAADDSEELYGDHQLVVDAIGDALHEIRETYAATLDESTADAYRAAFDTSARKRFGRYASAPPGGHEWR